MKTFVAKIWLFLVFVSSTLISYGQPQSVLPFMPNVSQSSYLMPFQTPEYDFVIGAIPILNSTRIGYANNSFTFNNIYERPFIQLNRIPNEINSRGFRQDLSFDTDLLHIRFRTRKFFWGLNITNRFQSYLTLPKDFFTLMIQGNAGFVNSNTQADLSNFQVQATSWNEYGLSFATPIGKNNKWQIGTRVKLLQGLAALQTERANISLRTTDQDNFSQAIGTDYRFNYGGIAAISDSSVSTSGNTGFQNVGFGLDLGGQYKYNEKWSFFASLSNLGYINWRQNTRNYTGRLNTVNFNGVKLSDIQDTSGNIDFEGFADSLENRFSGTESRENFSSRLAPELYMGASYQLSEKTKLNAAIYNRFQDGANLAFMLNGTQNVGRVLDVALSYNIYQNNFTNVGAGLMFKPGPVQLHLMVDNIPGLILLGNNRFTNVRFGLQFVGGNGKPKDKDGDGIPDREDACPTQAGPISLQGCPDTDNDGVADKDDKCPTEPGKIALQGCPDKDNDGIIDSKDRCPTIAGSEAFNGCPDKDGDNIADPDDDCPTEPGKPENKGCPDTDGDSVIDKLDKCPTTPGLVAFNGCPDSDNDGVVDSLDACPTLPGLAVNKGCPDTDGDGVFDNNDKCPTEKGSIDNNGCPYGDIDGDGVRDADDQCPETPGTVANKGCPELKKEEILVLRSAFDNLEFETNKDVIKEKSYASLDELALLLQKREDAILSIAGHTDNIGKPKFNLLLSKNRALAVKFYLSNKGVSKDRIKAAWFGGTKPIANNKTPQGRAKNRRVEMKISFK